MQKHKALWIATAILLVAAAFRAYRLHDLPPGLTHDEAGHGHDAAAVLRGVTPIYFPVGYGREPLFDYVNAGLMALLGPWGFTLRLAACFWGLLTVAASYRFAKTAFGSGIALLTAAFIAVSFWPVATGRQALRSGMLPVWMALAAWAFLRLPKSRRLRKSAFLVLTLSIAASLYTYIPARILWLTFPLALGVLALGNRPALRARWRPTLLALLAAGTMSYPLFNYLRLNPGAEQRLEMLDEPLDALRLGDPTPILRNTWATLSALVVPGRGDDFLAYTIPGRPLFDPLIFALFILGIGCCLWRWRQPACALSLAWLLIGVSPALVTGPAALTTRIIGAQPIIYVLPALGVTAIAQLISKQLSVNSEQSTHLQSSVPSPQSPIPNIQLPIRILAIVLIISIALISTRDYFIHWGEHPAIRAAYQSTLMAELAALAPPLDSAQPVIISTARPGVAHDPYIAELTPAGAAYDLHWADFRSAILLPPVQTATLLIPASTPPHPAFGLPPAEARIVSLRADDLDSTFRIATLHPDQIIGRISSQVTSPPKPVIFGDAIELVGAGWQASSYRPGEVAELLTVWQVHNPDGVGPHVPPAGRTDVVLFTHVLNADDTILAQRDALDAPSWQWDVGDTIVQVHSLPLPVGAPAGQYETIVGIYDRLSGERLAMGNGATTVAVQPLEVVAP